MSSFKEMQSLLSNPSTDDCCKIIKKTIHYSTKQIIVVENYIKKRMRRMNHYKRIMSFYITGVTLNDLIVGGSFQVIVL